MTEQEIAEIEQITEAATLGPWKATFGMDCRAFITTTDENSDFKVYNHADAAFIAHARADIPALLAEIRRLQEADRWIPVAERLPDRWIEVIVAYKDGFTMTERIPFDPDVTCWRPLPKPPEDTQNV